METYKKVQRFYELKPWDYQEIIRYDWSLSYGKEVKRNMELWLGKWDDFQDFRRLKLKISDVSIHAYSTIYFKGERTNLYVVIGQNNRYIFLDTYDSTDILFECNDFDFSLEQVGFEDW
jgi:hypothetical protein